MIQRSAPRMRWSLGHLGQDAVLALRIGRTVLPTAARELARWEDRARTIPNLELRRQAESSLAHKRFHAEGGSVYAAAVPKEAHRLVPLIVALQTISDYLDNLCDRSVALQQPDVERNFRQLHEAMLDAVSPGRPMHDYYRYHTDHDDGGYLPALVETCRNTVAQLPSYSEVERDVERLVSLYNDLQVYKHLPWTERERRLQDWFALESEPAHRLYWWEFGAACGSTLGVFSLFTLATRPGLPRATVDALLDAYFPWVTGLHILLDYLIDQAEDVAGGDLNFVAYYANAKEAESRLNRMATEARRRVLDLPDAAMHALVVAGLPGLYFASRKVREQRLGGLARRMLRTGGPVSLLSYGVCRLRRAAGTVTY